MPHADARLVLRGGTVIDGVAALSRRADVALRGESIEAVGEIAEEPGDVVIDCTGRLVMPGFVDAHSHGDAVVFDPAVQLSLLRQGVTTVVGGQDGVSFAPGDGVWPSEYFAGINGAHPSFRGGSVADLLATYDGTTPLNVGYLVPAGTVRHTVMGMAEGRADAAQLDRMRALVAAGMADGALGLSTGLDYVPGIYADAVELAALSAPVAAADGLYVTHMRGGYEKNSAIGIDEVARIHRLAGVRAHVSHLHLDADDAWRLLDGLEVTFDMYPYTRGCTLISMAVLPPRYSALPVDQAVALLRDPAEREALRTEWFPQVAHKPSLGPAWPDMIAVAHASAAHWADAPGRTLAQLSAARGTAIEDLTLDLLADTRMTATAVMAVHDERPAENLARLFSHPGFRGGSDGIFIGAAPHPRAHGAFARYLGTYTGDDGWFTWEQIAQRLSGFTARDFRLGARGAVRAGWIADLIVVDPATAADRATYEDPTATAVGIDDVFVAGEPVLRGGELTGARSGRGIRRTPQPD